MTYNRMNPQPDPEPKKSVTSLHGGLPDVQKHVLDEATTTLFKRIDRRMGELQELAGPHVPDADEFSYYQTALGEHVAFLTVQVQELCVDMHKIKRLLGGDHHVN